MGPETNLRTDELPSVFLVKAPPVPENTSIIVEDIKIRKGQWINKGQLIIVLKTKSKGGQDEFRSGGSTNFEYFVTL